MNDETIMNDKGRNHNTFLYINTYISHLYFIKKPEFNCQCDRDRETGTEDSYIDP